MYACVLTKINKENSNNGVLKKPGDINNCVLKNRRYIVPEQNIGYNPSLF